MLNPKKMLKTERAAAAGMVAAFRRIERDLHCSLLEQNGTIPEDWFDIETEEPTVSPERTRITLRLDLDVVRFFRGLGPGYQARINTVLRAYVLGRLSRIIEGPDATDWVLHPERMEERPMAEPPLGTRERRELEEARRQRAEAERLSAEARTLFAEGQRLLAAQLK